MLRHPRWSCGISLLLGLCATAAGASGRSGEERKAPAGSNTEKVDRLAEEIALTRRYPLFGMTGPRAYRGYALGAGADLRGADLKGAPLSRARLAGADLRDADLRGAWLVDASLDGANLEGARLEGAILDGASLKRARMFSARIDGAHGLALAGAELHPFFEIAAGEPFGTIKYLRTRDLEAVLGVDPPCQLLLGGNGRLGWITSRTRQMTSLGRTGIRFLHPISNRSQVAQAVDAKGRTWVVEGDRFVIHDTDQPGEQKNDKDYRYSATAVAFPAPKGIFAMQGLADGSMAVFHRRGMLRIGESRTATGRRGGETTTISDWHAGKGEELVAGCFNASGSHFFVLDKSHHRIERIPAEGGTSAFAALDRGWAPKRLVPGADNRVYLTLAGGPGLVALGLEEKDLQVIDLPSRDRGMEDIFGLTGTDGACLGPDGNIWFTEPQQNRIGRLDVKEGIIEDYYLGDGVVPLDIVASPEDGTLLFTVKDQDVIGSFRAVERTTNVLAPLPAAAVERKEPREGRVSSWVALCAPVATGAGPVAEEPAERVREKRRSRAKARMEGAQAWLKDGQAPSRPTGWEGVEEAGAPGKGDSKRQDAAPLSAGDAEGGPAREERKGPARSKTETRDSRVEEAWAAAADKEWTDEGLWNAAEVLSEHGVALTQRRTRRILWKHRNQAGNGKSEFAEAHSSQEALTALLAEGVQQAGGPGQVFDADGSYYTYCKKANVGRCLTGFGDQARWTGTDRFVIVSTRRWNEVERQYEFVVLTAFPVLWSY